MAEDLAKRIDSCVEACLRVQPGRSALGKFNGLEPVAAAVELPPGIEVLEQETYTGFLRCPLEKPVRA